LPYWKRGFKNSLINLTEEKMYLNNSYKLVAMLALLAIVVLSGCSTTAPEQAAAAELEKQIEEAVWTYEEALQSGDLERLMGLYADDVVSLPPGFPKTEGKADLEASLQEFFDAYAIERDFELVNVQVAGDTATRLGEWTQTLTPKDGGAPIVETGRCILGYEKVGNEWKVAWEIWNTYEYIPGYVAVGIYVVFIILYAFIAAILESDS
jgi:uncharacterized protein (TIGR02246 family)